MKKTNIRKRKPKKDYSQDDERTLTEDILDFIKVFVISAIVILLVTRFIAHPVNVVGRSMDPTLQDGEYGFTSIISLAFDEPSRLDVVVVSVEDPETGEDERWVKRIIGMPGETVQGKNGKIYINGKVFDETSYIDQEYKQKCIDELGYFDMEFDEVKLGDDEYFLMGDNRPYSKDSRYTDVGPVTKSQIFGKGVFVVFPFNKIGGH